MKKYETEVRERWGNTDAYREHTEKTKHCTKEKWADAGMAEFASAAIEAYGKGRNRT